MASEPDRPPADDDTVVVGSSQHSAAEESTRAGDEAWPVTDLYYVEPAGDASAPPREAAAEDIVLTQASAPPPVRRFPPDVGPGLLLVLLAVAAALVLGAIYLALDDEPAASTQAPPSTAQPTAPTDETTTTTTPAADERVGVTDVEGMTLAEARAALEKQGLRVRVRRIPSDRPRGEIISQSPAAEAEVGKGAVVVLVVSRGPETSQPLPEAQVDVPSLVGRSASSAVVAVRDLGLEARVRPVTSSERPGTVVGQSPAAGTVVDEGTTVQLEVAKARPQVQRIEVPDVVGATAADARSELRSLGLTVSTVSVVSQEPPGTVIEQSPPAGTELRKGARVRLTVSAGPATVDVPDVTGLDEASARLELEGAGFRVQVIDEPVTDPAQDGIVLRQTPQGGSSAREGAVITLTVGRLD